MAFAKDSGFRLCLIKESFTNGQVTTTLKFLLLAQRNFIPIYDLLKREVSEQPDMFKGQALFNFAQVKIDVVGNAVSYILFSSKLGEDGTDSLNF